MYRMSLTMTDQQWEEMFKSVEEKRKMKGWSEVSEDHYNEMLNILPPAIMEKGGFLVGEPMEHRFCTVTKGFRASYSAFRERNGKFYGHSPMTVPEYRTDNF